MKQKIQKIKKRSWIGRYTKPNVWDQAGQLEIRRGNEKLDPGVNYFVAKLDELGVITCFSCEGHPNGFYVFFGGAYEQALRIRGAGYFSVEVEGENHWSIRIHKEESEPERVDHLRWAAAAWEKAFGKLNLEKIRLSEGLYGKRPIRLLERPKTNS